MEVAFLLIATWAGGVEHFGTAGYDHCWENADLMWIEQEYIRPAPDAGELLMTACLPTDIILSAPAPKFRPTT